MSGHRVKSAMATALVAIVLSFTGLLAPVSAATVSTKILAPAWVRDSSSTNNDICPPFDTLPTGTTVQMQCYKNESYASGNGYSGNLWFLVSASDGARAGVVGYVHSSYVSWPQPVVGPCDNMATERAVRWAVNGIGTPGIAGAPRGGPGYYGWCLQFVADAYSYGAGINIGSADTAALWWKAAGSRQIPNWNAPRGSLVFWTSGTAGHVAMSLGGGRAVSTWDGKDSKIHVITNLGGIGLTYIGWVGIA
jgi:NlpC/P60 family